MGYNEMWGAIGSKFAEPGVVTGCMVFRSAAGALKVKAGIVRLKKTIGTYHTMSVDLQVGDRALADSEAIDVSGFDDGVYGLYAHPTVDNAGETTGVELRYGGKFLKADGTNATTLANAYMDGTATDNAKTVRVCPEPNYDPSAAKMLSSVPVSDFYKGRSILLALFVVGTGDVAEGAIANTIAHRVR